MGDFDDILKKKLNQMGIGRQVEAVGVVEKATEEIAKHIPREDFEVVSFNRGILKIKVANSVVGSEIISRRSQVLGRLDQVKTLKITQSD